MPKIIGIQVNIQHTYIKRKYTDHTAGALQYIFKSLNTIKIAIQNIRHRLLLSVPLTVVLLALINIIHSPTSLAAPTPDSCFAYTTNLGEVTITDYYDNEGNNVLNPACTRQPEIPNTLGGDPVTTIANMSFNYTQITNVTIPNSVTSIGDEAFAYNQLNSLTIPNTVTYIGVGAFRSNQIPNVSIPDSVTYLGMGAFFQNNLSSATISNSITSIEDSVFRENQIASIIIPSSVTSIGFGAFSDNQLTSIIIPSSVTTIGHWAFENNQLTNVTIQGNISANGNGVFNNNPINYFDYNGSIYTGSDPITDICYEFNGTETITGFNKSDLALIRDNHTACLNPNITIPNTLNGNTVTTIGNGAFYEKHLTGIIIPSTIINIGGGAFQKNQLTSLNIPSSVTSIGNYSFNENLLTTVSIPSSITTIPNHAFSQNNLVSLTIPNSVTSISEHSFSNNHLSNVSLGNATTSIGNWAFINNNLVSLTIPDSLTTIGIGAFLNNRLENILFGDSLTNIGSIVFAYNNISTLVLPDTVTSIDNGAFMGNVIAEIYISDSLATLNSMALTAQTIPTGTRYADFAANPTDTLVAQQYLNSVIYSSIYATSSQISTLGLQDVAMPEGADINADGDQTDIMSGHLINPARITLNYKDSDGNTIAPSTTHTGTGLSSYLAVENTANDLGLYYKAGESFTVPAAPNIAGYTITTTPSNVGNLNAGNNTLEYVYSTNNGSGENNNNDDNGNNNGGGNINNDNQGGDNGGDGHSGPNNPVTPRNFTTPTITITSPTPDQKFLSGSQVTLSANVTGIANIKEVRFYVDDQLVGTVSSAPYQLTLDDLADGSHVLTAIVEDINGVQTTASPQSFSIAGEQDYLSTLGFNKYNGGELDASNEVVQASDTPAMKILRSLPWASLLILSAVYLTQAYRQARQNKLLKHQLQLANQTQSLTEGFLSIVSHYLGTSATLVALAGDVLPANEAGTPAAQTYKTTAIKFKDFVNATIEQISQRAGGIKQELQAGLIVKRFSIRNWVILPSLVAATILLISFVGWSGVWNDSLATKIFASTMLLAAIGLTATFFIIWQHQRQLQSDLTATIDLSNKLLNTKRSFIQETSQDLTNHAKQIAQAGSKLTQPAFQKSLAGGTKQLAFVTKAFASILQITSPSTIQSVRTNQTGSSRNSNSNRSSNPNQATNAYQPITQSLANLQSLASSNNVTIKSSISPKLTTNLTPAELDHIITSLVTNAIQFSKPGSNITINASNKGKQLNLSVTDHGSGIAKDKLNILTQPFVRASSTETYNHEGLGLSLYITRLITDKYQGSLNISSQKGKGTRVVVGV